jgi:hypothetical protein
VVGRGKKGGRSPVVLLGVGQIKEKPILGVVQKPDFLDRADFARSHKKFPKKGKEHLGLRGGRK